jgi:dTDP-glucose 4,6-dehydratase
LLCKLTNKNPKTYIKYISDRPGHDRRYAIDYSKTTKDLGWAPHISFEEGMKKTTERYYRNS